MNEHYDTSMLPQTDLIRVCLSCWRRVPTLFARKIRTHHFPSTTSLTCQGTCGNRWTRALSMSQKQLAPANKQENTDISTNPFFSKYQQKLQHMKETNPDEFKAKIEKIEENKAELKMRVETPPAAESLQKPEIPGYTGPKSWPPKSLDEIMKLDLVKDLDTKAITQIWQEHHLSKDCVFSVVPEKDYDEMLAKSKLNPTFIFPLPKGDGFEFYLCQFSGKDVYFTSLGMYQLVKENAPPCLSVAHFPELKEDKGIALMAGEYDKKVISKTEALNLVKQMTLYYGVDSGERYKLVRQFTMHPDQFQYLDVVEQYKANKDYLENNPY